jgi:hypothetical protein
LNDDELEATLLSSIESSDDLGIMMRAEITEEDFGNIIRPVYSYFINHVRQYQKMPPLTLLAQTFADFTPRQIIGSVDALSVELKKRSVSRRARMVLIEQIKNIESDPYGTIDGLNVALSALKPRSSLSLSVTDQTAGARYDRYVEKGKTGLLGTIPTGWDFFDKRSAYWQYGELVGFVARPFVGKSWSIIHSSAVAWASGFRVLFVSPELGIDEAEKRFDVCAARLSGSPIILSDLRYGHESSQDNYRRYVEAASQRKDFHTIDSVNGKKVTPQRLMEVANKFKPDIISIDGIGFMGDDNKSSAGWERIYNVCVDLKQLGVMNRFATLTVQQVKPQVPGHRVPGLEDVMYGDGFVQTCDRVITLSFNEDSSLVRDMTVQKDRITGEPILERRHVTFNPDIGDFGREV